MAEEFQRSKLYQYTANSNLVLEAEREGRRRTDEGTGEVETLHGKLGTVRMGDRIDRDKKVDFDNRIEKAKQKRLRSDADLDKVTKKKKDSENFAAVKGSNVLTETEDLTSISYRPRTRESRAAYEEILSFVQSNLGDQPHDILRGAADEILAILKDDHLRDPERQSSIEKLLSKVSSERFNKLVNLGKKILDFNARADFDESENQKMDEEMGVAVVFDDEEEGDNDDVDEVNPSEDEEEEEGVEAFGSGTLKGEEGGVDAAADDTYNLDVHDIDAHWLQRKLSKYYVDANVSAKLADDTLAALQISDERSCENRLVVLLDFDKFDFIKLLLKNRTKIYFCTRLKQSQSDAEKEAILQEMSVGKDGVFILNQLNQKASVESWAQDRIGEFASKARREARAIIRSDRPSDSGYDESEEFLGTPQVEGEAAPKPEKLVDLDSLQFNQGSHLMANKRCELPEKSWRALKKGYEEVHVPAVRPIVPADERLIEVSELPSWAQPAFQKGGVKVLNRIQSRMVPAALYSSENLLLCAPTSAGKTNVALLCILNQLGQHMREDNTFDLSSFKVVYVAPMKALVQECVHSFGEKLAPFGINVRELSGDQNLTRQQIQDTQMIVTTPEKWDIITRKAGDRTYTQLVRLLIIDEIHLLHDSRGPVLESLVARTIRQVETTQEMVRLVGLSATLPNFEDVATFLRVNPEKGLFFFDNSFRPVPLQQQYIGITEKKALKRFQLMNEICYEKVLQRAGRNQVLIFTHSRAETVKTARALRDMALSNDTIGQFVADDGASREILREESESVKNADLKDLIPYGFAVHHAGLVRSDRTLVEDLFADKHIQVLVSTATLAWGVNLPCHTVIIKGTQMYSPEQGRWVELSPLDIMQMMGRAGRYGLDSEGEGIILTAHSELQFYLSLMNQQLPIESQLVSKLPDMLNAELVLGSVQSIREAASWLGYTYLYVRMLRNPSLYGISVEDLESDPSLLQRRVDLAHAAAMVLDKQNLIKYDRKSGIMQATALGRVASFYYVTHDSISVFNEYLKPSMNEIEIFRLFSLSGEFKQIYVRDEEKLELMKLITRVPVPVKEGVEEPSAKVNVLLQAYISRLKLEGFALVADMTYVQQSACRLMRALFEVALKRGWAALSAKTLTLCKMVERRIWSSQSPLRQFSSIPEVIIRKLEKNSDISWDRYYDLKPQDLGEMVKIPKMGKTLHKYVHLFPRVELSAHIQPITRSMIKIDLTISPDFEFDANVHESALLFWIIVEDGDGEKILHHEPFILRAHHAKDDHDVTFCVPMQDPMPPQYFVKVVSDRWLHSEAVLAVSFRHLILPQKYPPSTELLDLQPLPVSALGDPSLCALYHHFKNFNAIQTQTFNALFQTTENVLICAPTGSGKTVCAELAIIHQSVADPTGKCVYVAPKEETVEIKYNQWRSSLSETLGKTIVKLTGEIASDVKLLEQGNLILATSVQWDALSRRWKQRKAVQNVSLYVFDDMHLLGGPEGPTLEIVVSRARYVSSQLDRSVRIIGLSSSLANARDVGDWVGASPNCTFNFAPDVRPVPLELHIHGFEASHFSSRLLAMAKPAYNSILVHSKHQPALIFVPSRKQAQLTAIDMMTFSAVAGGLTTFLRVEDDVLSPALNAIKDPALAQTLRKGVGFLHEGISRNDREIVEGLYRDGIIGVLVCPKSLCWSLSISCHLVVIMDTVFYEGRERRFVDYSITDIMQMIGFASRPLDDDVGKCVLLCYSPKKDSLKKLLLEPLPIESHLDKNLHDHFSAEVVTKTVENKQDAVDYLTWTFYYRRLAQNPNYYNLLGASHRHLSDHLSELVESVVSDLEESKCIAVEDDMDLSPLNLGMIASYYYIQYTTIEVFSSSVTAKTKMKGLMEILASSSEYSALPMRQAEDRVLQKIANHLPQPMPDDANFEDPATKALVLLQSHFTRQAINTDLAADAVVVLSCACKLLQALVDVISSQGWLRPALASMELSQMIVQGVWAKDSVLLQIPHFTGEIVARCEAHSPPVENVFDILDLEDEARESLLQLSEEKMSDVALFCNAYPNLELAYTVDEQVCCGDSVKLQVTLQRAGEDAEDIDFSGFGEVVSSHYPLKKKEGWWLLVGDKNSNSLLSIKRIAVDRTFEAKLEFSAPEDPGDYNYVLYLMSDSYIGCDQEYEFNIAVTVD